MTQGTTIAVRVNMEERRIHFRFNLDRWWHTDIPECFGNEVYPFFSLRDYADAITLNADFLKEKDKRRR